MFSNTHNPGYNGEHAIYLVRLWESGNHTPGVHVIYESSSFYTATIGKTTQNTVYILDHQEVIMLQLWQWEE